LRNLKIAGHTNFNLKETTNLDRDKILKESNQILEDDISNIDFTDLDSLKKLET
jgi:hypothetical protein